MNGCVGALCHRPNGPAIAIAQAEFLRANQDLRPSPDRFIIYSINRSTGGAGMTDFVTDIVVAEGPGVEVVRHISHHGYFYGHYDAELEERVLPAAETFTGEGLDWPAGALVLRIMHRLIRVRRIWGEEFPGSPENLKSRRVLLRPGTRPVRSREALREFRNALRDYAGADRLLRLGHVEAVVVEPEAGTWGKMRFGETVR